MRILRKQGVERLPDLRIEPAERSAASRALD